MRLEPIKEETNLGGAIVGGVTGGALSLSKGAAVGGMLGVALAELTKAYLSSEVGQPNILLAYSVTLTNSHVTQNIGCSTSVSSSW